MWSSRRPTISQQCTVMNLIENLSDHSCHWFRNTLSGLSCKKERKKELALFYSVVLKPSLWIWHLTVPHQCTMMFLVYDLFGYSYHWFRATLSNLTLKNSWQGLTMWSSKRHLFVDLAFDSPSSLHIDKFCPLLVWSLLPSNFEQFGRPFPHKERKRKSWHAFTMRSLKCHIFVDFRKNLN